MLVASTASDDLRGIGLIRQPAASKPPSCAVIAVQVRQDLIGAPEVLDSRPVGLGSTGVGVETGSFNRVAVAAVPGCLEHVSPCPGVVGDVAGFMLVEGRGA